MIIWISKPTSSFSPSLGLRSWRWNVKLEKWRITLEEEVKSEEYDWRPANDYYSLYFSKEFSIGYDSVYYDGDHRTLNFGFIKFGWFK